jgi:branched-chain amino acid transport system permease protein
MALLGGATSVWGPMLGVVPLVLISDYLSVTVPHYFSVVLGLVLLAIVFFVPDGLIGVLRSMRDRVHRERLSRLLHALAERIGSGAVRTQRRTLPAAGNGSTERPAQLQPAGEADRTVGP